MVLSTPSAPSGLAKISLNTLQAISGECSIDGYQLKLRRGVGVESLASRIGKYLEPPIQVRTWREAGGELVAMLAMEKSAMFLSLSCIIAMAAFCMASALAGNVARKTQEIGLLLAIGCSKGGIALSFLLQSLGIGVLGIAIGSCLAAGILSMRDGLLRLLMTTFGGEERLFSFYGFSHLPLHVHGGDVVKIFILAIAATLVAGLLPVCRILRIDPSQALHHE
jgi:lipoprotein-releasing system permease protein